MTSTATRFGAFAVLLALLVGGIAFGLQSAKAAPSPVNLVGHWTLDEGAGATAANLGTTTYPGSLQNTPTWGVGKLGNALTFQSSQSEYVQIGNVTQINGAQKASLSAWIKRTSTGAVVVVGKESSTNRFAIETRSNGTIRLHVSSSANAYGALTLNDTNWHHVTLVFDGALSGNANRLKGYVDGAPVTLSFTGTIPTTTTTNTNAFRIGRMGSTYSNGSIDDVWLFSRALTPAEVADLAAVAPDTTVPTVPGTPSATNVAQTSLTLTWTPSSDNIGVVGYKVFRNGVQVATSTATSTLQTGLTANTTYSYSLRAYDAAGNVSAESGVLNVTTAAPDTEAPTVPGSLFGTPSSFSVSLSWASSTDNVGVAGYKVFRNGTLVGTTSARTYNVGNLAASTTYSFSVSAFDLASNESAQSPAIEVTTLGASTGGLSLPLHISADKRNLEDANGQVFPILGEAAWSLIAGPNKAGAEQYLDDRKAKGTNAILVNLIEHFPDWGGTADADGDQPFLTMPVMSTPNEAYFEHADFVIREAAERGIVVFLFPTYLGWQGGAQGWYQDIVNNNTEADMLAWGQFVGERYKNDKNIVWVIAGDHGPNAALGKLRKVVEGIQEHQPDAVFTVHSAQVTSVDGYYNLANDPWIDMENIYYYGCTSIASHMLGEYNETPTMPVFYIEGYYENHEGTRECRRWQEYWPMLTGGNGYFFGTGPVWNFNSGWQSGLQSVGSQDFARANKLFASRPYFFTPDQSHTVLTSGWTAPGNSYVGVGRAPNGDSVVIYTPNARTLTVNMTQIGGTTARAWWYSPITGAVTDLGTFPTTGSQNFVASGEMVLVLDNAALGLSAPGTVAPPAPDTQAPTVPANLTATATTTSATALSWNASTDNVSVAGYKVFRGGSQIGTTTALSFYNSGLSAGTAYTYNVAAYDGAGNVSAQSGSATATTTSPDSISPSAPGTPFATNVTHNSVTLLWHPSTDNVGVVGYKILSSGSQVGTSTATSTVQGGLTPVTTYTFTITAYDAMGNVSTESGSVEVTTTAAPDVTIPTATLTAPTNGATVSGSVALTATASDNVGVAGVTFYVDGAVFGSEDTEAPYEANWDSTLVSEGAHGLRARARDAAGNLGWSATSTVTVDNIAAPGLPTVELDANPLSVFAGATTTLSWTSTDAASCAASGGWSGSKTTSGNQTVTVSSGTTYTLTCTNETGNGADSVSVTILAPQCSDGLDNDNDGKTDYGTSATSFTNIYAFTGGVLGLTTEGAGVDGGAIANTGVLPALQATNNGYTSDPSLRAAPRSGATAATSAVTQNSYFTFSVSPEAGKTVNLSTLNFNAARGGSGTPRGYVLRSSVDNYAANIATAALTTARPTWSPISINLGALGTLASTTTFRMYVYAPATDTSVEFDDITVNGTVQTAGGGNFDAQCSSASDNDESN